MATHFREQEAAEHVELYNLTRTEALNAVEECVRAAEKVDVLLGCCRQGCKHCGTRNPKATSGGVP